VIMMETTRYAFYCICIFAPFVVRTTLGTKASISGKEVVESPYSEMGGGCLFQVRSFEMKISEVSYKTLHN